MNDVFLERLEKLTSKYPKVIDLSLVRVNKLLNKLDNPHLKLPPIIHVAGTNGKGSTIAFLFNSLKCAGKKVHVYTSPHLIEVTERIILANKKITYTKLFQALDYCEKVNNGERITQFELLTCIAFFLMSKTKADVTLLETGLGGRLDATNIIKNPILTIITSISKDHSDFLGNKLRSIAEEKAGIIKRGITCISAPQNMEVKKVLIDKCKERKAKLIISDQKSFISYENNGFKIHKSEMEDYLFPYPSLEGPHQVINAALAITALITVPELRIGLKNINQGIVSTYWPGRLEKISKIIVKRYSLRTEDIWLDGGHNIAGAQAIKNWITHKKIKEIILVCGFLKNKDAEDILFILKDYIKYIIFVPIDNKNSYTVEELSIMSKKLDISYYVSSSVKEAITSNLISKSSKVLIFGSLYLIGAILKLKNN